MGFYLQFVVSPFDKKPFHRSDVKASFVSARGGGACRGRERWMQRGGPKRIVLRVSAFMGE